MLMVTAVRDNGRKVVVADTDDMVLEAIKLEDYVNYLLSGGYIDNLDPNCCQILCNNRDNLDNIGVSVLVDTSAILWEGKPHEIYLHHSMRDMSMRGFRAKSKDGMFYFKQSGCGAIAIIWIKGIMYYIAFELKGNEVHITCNGVYTIMVDDVNNNNRDYQLSLLTFSGSGGRVRLKLSCGIEISADGENVSFTYLNTREYAHGIECDKERALSQIRSVGM